MEGTSGNHVFLVARGQQGGRGPNFSLQLLQLALAYLLQLALAYLLQIALAYLLQLALASKGGSDLCLLVPAAAVTGSVIDTKLRAVRFHFHKNSPLEAEMFLGLKNFVWMFFERRCGPSSSSVLLRGLKVFRG